MVTITGTTVATTFTINLVTSNRTYQNILNRTAASTNAALSIGSLVDMDAADTATVTITVSGEAADTDDILGGSTLTTFFAGELVT